jgi:serine/threonine protein kinase
MQQQKESAAQEASILGLGVKMGMLTNEQVSSVSELQKQMRRAGISLPVGQTLLERKYLNLEQLKTLRQELAKRAAAADAAKAAVTPQKPTSTKKFGQYEILKTLSEKDRARVFKARDTVMNRVVVLKVLPRSAAQDPMWGERFRREMLLAGKLVHPNIATAYGGGEVDGNPLMTIEFVEGMSLGERLEREGNLQEKVAWMVAREVAKGLAFAASLGVVHRDIKPDNILCSDDGKIKIIDLGLSKAQGDTSGLTMEGTTVGTPFYIAPEQARGTKDLDQRTDLYSLGCTVFHMLTGSVPFFHEEFTEVMLKQTQAPRPDPRSILPEISEGSAKLVMRMMAIDPKDRQQSFDELLQEIEALLPTLPKPTADVRPVAQVASSDTGNKREEIWVPPAPAPASKGQASASKVPAYKATPKATAFAKAGEGEVPPQSVLQRFSAWIGKLFGK